MRLPRPVRQGCIALSLVVLSFCCFSDRVIIDALRPIAYTALKSIRQYDGCACEDCATRFVGFQPYRNYGCRAPGPMTAFGLMAGVASLLFASGVAFAAVSGRAAPIRANRCARCDYDLAGLPSGRCPECGSLHEPV